MKKVVPKKKVEPVTYRVEPGSSLMIGGLARIDLHEESKSFLITLFISNEIKVHPCKTSKADELLDRHFGKMLSPPVCEEEEREERRKIMGGEHFKTNNNENNRRVIYLTPYL